MAGEPPASSSTRPVALSFPFSIFFFFTVAPHLSLPLLFHRKAVDSWSLSCPHGSSAALLRQVLRRIWRLGLLCFPRRPRRRSRQAATVALLPPASTGRHGASPVLFEGHHRTPALTAAAHRTKAQPQPARTPQPARLALCSPSSPNWPEGPCPVSFRSYEDSFIYDCSTTSWIRSSSYLDFRFVCLVGEGQEYSHTLLVQGQLQLSFA